MKNTIFQIEKYKYKQNKETIKYWYNITYYQAYYLI